MRWREEPRKGATRTGRSVWPVSQEASCSSFFPQHPLSSLLATPIVSTCCQPDLCTRLLRALLLHLEGVGHDQQHPEGVK